MLRHTGFFRWRSLRAIRTENASHLNTCINSNLIQILNFILYCARVFQKQMYLYLYTRVFLFLFLYIFSMVSNYDYIFLFIFKNVFLFTTKIWAKFFWLRKLAGQLMFFRLQITTV